MVCCNIILNIILIPKDIQLFNLNLAGLGAKGAAIATVFAYGTGLFYSRVTAWKLTKLKGNPKIILHALAAVAMATILYFILYELKLIEIITRWYHLLGSALIGIIVYIFILWVLKEFTKKDFHFFL